MFSDISEIVSISIVRGKYDVWCIHMHKKLSSVSTHTIQGTNSWSPKFVVLVKVLSYTVSSVLSSVLIRLLPGIIRGISVFLLKLIGCSHSQGLSSLSGECSLFFLLVYCAMLCYYWLTLFLNEWNLNTFLASKTNSNILHARYSREHFKYLTLHIMLILGVILCNYLNVNNQGMSVDDVQMN